jgi:hypothetical protein
MQAFQPIATIALLGIGLLALHFLLNWVTRERPKDYRNRGSAGVGNAFLTVQAMLEPSRRHELEQRLVEPEEAAEQGDPPPTGTAREKALPPSRRTTRPLV